MDGAVQEHLRYTDVQTTIYTKPKRLVPELDLPTVDVDRPDIGK
jgi:hypothetical protein